MEGQGKSQSRTKKKLFSSVKNTEKGPVESFVLTPDEFEEFRSDAKNHRTSFKKISGRTDDDIGGDWTYKGALIQISGKIKS